MCGEVNYAGFSEDAGEQSSFLQCYGIWVVNYIIVTRYRREMIYILTVRQAVQVVGGVQNLLENFLSTSPQRAIDKLYRLYKRSKSKRLVKRKDVLLSRPSFQLLTHSSPQTSPILKVR